MSTLYEVDVTAVDDRVVELRVQSVQPESAPLYETARFALALLCESPGYEGSQLAAQLPPESVIAVSEGDVDPSPYIESVHLEHVNEEVGAYRIVTTSAAWTHHLEPSSFESVAWDEVSDMEAAFGPDRDQGAD